MEVFEDYAYYYNAFYENKDYKKEAMQIKCLLDDHGMTGNRILNMGCGTGRHDIRLTQMGYQCSGIDISPAMIDIARQNARGMEIDFTVADVRNYRTARRYDAVISLFHVMSYQNSNTDIINAFVSAREALDPGGVFIFDVWYGPGVLSDKPCVRVREVEDEENRIVRIARPIMHDKENLVDVCYEVLIINKRSNVVKMINEVHHMRYFFRPELEMLLVNAGFDLIDNLDCRTMQETDYDSWTSYFIARAK